MCNMDVENSLTLYIKFAIIKLEIRPPVLGYRNGVPLKRGAFFFKEIRFFLLLSYP